MSGQTRPVYLAVYPARLFAAHWAFWIPTYNVQTNEVYNVGKMIEVVGDPSQGFQHQITRNHDITNSRNTPVQVLLGQVWDSQITDGTNEGQPFVDNTPKDLLEEWAMYIPAPGPSLRRAASSRTTARGSASGSSSSNASVCVYSLNMHERR